VIRQSMWMFGPNVSTGPDRMEVEPSGSIVPPGSECVARSLSIGPGGPWIQHSEMAPLGIYANQRIFPSAGPLPRRTNRNARV
jgi:hypothetical protein